jgi:FKBP-type peptidyl-prolyl cis-trans isomerase FkpA
MRKSLLGLFILVLLVSVSCNKDSGGSSSCPYTDYSVTVPASELTAVENYLTVKGITNATKDSRGFYYTIQAAGSGMVATPCSSITIFYQGKLTNDTVFDQTGATPRSFVLGQLIPGWIKGIPLVKPGGSITLYLPPSLGYGNVANGPIPANSILIFDIQLQIVQ